MNAFEQASTVEAEAYSHLTSFIRASSKDGQFVFTDKGPLSKWLQKEVGDILMNSPDSRVWTIELKAERKKTGNFFLETWSNRKWETRGWMHTLRSDLLFYYFIDARELYIIPMQKLKDWFNDNAHGYEEKPQNKYKQLNDTWGAIVSIADVYCQVGFKLFIDGGFGFMKQELESSEEPQWFTDD